MSKWKKYQISELCSDIVDCVNKTAPISLTETPYKMLRTSDIRDGFVNLENLNCVTEDVFEKWSRRGKLEKNDIIFTREAPLGEAAIVRNPENYFLGQRLVLFRANPDICDSRFLLYSFLNPTTKNGLKQRGVGSTVTHMRVPECKKIEIYAPDLSTQKRIASILSTYDNLIENNQKQIKLLEEAAQRLYQEWFVKLRFPGHEKVKVVDGVPEGWNRVPLENTIEYEIGGGWGNDSEDEKFTHPAYVIRGTDIYGVTHGDFLSVPFRFHTEKNLSARQLEDGDIVFEVSGGSKTEGVAKTALIRSALLDTLDYPVMCASFCKLVRFHNKGMAQYMYDTFQYLRSSGVTAEFDKKSASSIVNYRWKDFLIQQDVLVPPDDVLHHYNGISERLYDQIMNQSVGIGKLKEARDRLLPKLMSGEI